MYLRNSPNICLAVFLITFCSYTYGTKRDIHCTIYHDKNESKENVDVFHVSAAGSKDTVHYLWSSYRLPSVIVARTTRDTHLNVSLSKLRTFVTDAIKFSKTPIEYVGLTISELWEFTYNSDTAEVISPNSTRKLNLKSFLWSSMKDSYSCSPKAASTKLNSFNDDYDFSQNGTFQVQFSVIGDQVMADDFPHLMFTGNSTQIKVILDRLHSNSSKTRYSLELMVFSPQSGDCSSNQWRSHVTKAISDEHSPGIFSDIALSPVCTEKNDPSFISWRPVSYTDRTSSIEASSDVKITSDIKPHAITSVQSIAELYFGGKPNMSINAFNITFGTVGDGFYPKTEYTAWSLMVGTGSTVSIGLSSIAILYASIGLSALVLFFISGGIFLAVQRCWRKDDDLLLSNNSI
ncbi:Lysosomal protein NCU-G1, partial [Stegodyphus mimosarum]